MFHVSCFMKTYELTYIISSANGLEKSAEVTKDVDSLIQANEGIIIKSEKTTAQMLAYAIKKQRSGYFVMVEFQGEETKIKIISDEIEKYPQIIRQMITVKKPVKIIKERRTRKPIFEAGKINEQVFTKNSGLAKKETKVQMEELTQKLDEILSE